VDWIRTKIHPQPPNLMDVSFQVYKEAVKTLRSAWLVAHRIMSFVRMAHALALLDLYEIKTAVEVSHFSLKEYNNS
jgi:hypothetical protein